MKRKLIKQLLEWKEESHKKPILLYGARGVGKTYLAFDFAKTYYTDFIYINFEREPHLYELFTDQSDFSITDKLIDYFHLTNSSESILLIFDEIIGCPDLELITNIITHRLTQFDTIVISSILSDTISSSNVYSKQLQLFPLDFEEFLDAMGNEWYIEVIKWHYDSNKALPNIVHEELLNFLDDYLQIGGMPSAVNEYINTESKCNVSEQHRILINSYLFDVGRHNMEGESLKITQVFQTLDKQLMKDNRKFQYTLIRKGATQAIYADAMQYIKNTFYGIVCSKIGDDTLDDYANGLTSSLETSNQNGSFKLFMQDVGMLYSTIRTKTLDISETVKKGILENYVAETLISNGYTVQFWESGSQAKIDFVIVKDSNITPIEVRTNANTRSKNISVFKTKCSQMNDSIKISTRNFEYSNSVKYVPIYAVFCI